MHEFDDLRVLVQAHSPLIVIESYEEPRALLLIKRLAVNLMRPVFKWTITDGLQRLDSEQGSQAFNADPTNLLAQIKGTRNSSIYVLCDFHPFLSDPKHVRYIKEIAQAHEQLGHTLILLSHAIEIPPELARLCYRFALSLPSDQQIRQLVHDMADSYSAKHGMLAELSAENVALLVQNLRGLTFDEVKRLAYKAIADDGAVTKEDIPRINRAKFSLLQTDGVLSQVFDSGSFANVIGLDNLKKWIAQRQQAFIDNAKDTPKGLLLTGVQGTGKSLAAKAIAGSWHLPLLRLDMAALYNKYIGETEKNLTQALALADAAVDFEALRSAPDAQVYETLVAISGIGRWTAEMYLMFALGRVDVFAPDDMALQEGAKMLFDLPERPKPKPLAVMAEAWAPWRSVAARALWAYYGHMKSRQGETL